MSISLSRLAGVAFVVPVINYRWPSLPENLINVDYRRKVMQWSLWFAKYAPGLLHWWTTQNWFPSSNAMETSPLLFNNKDIEVMKKIQGFPMLSKVKIKTKKSFQSQFSYPLLNMLRI